MPHFICETLPIYSSVHTAGNGKAKKHIEVGGKGKKKGGGETPDNCTHSFEGELIKT